MSQIGCSAVLLALAVLITPTSHRRITRRRVSRPRPRWLMPVLVTVGVAAAAATVPVTTVAAAAIVTVTVLARRRRRARRTRSATQGRALTAALETLVSELRVGATPVRAFRVAALEAPPELGSALHDVSARAELGADVAAGLRTVARRSPLTGEWERLAMSWSLATEHGLAVAALMRTAQLDIVERLRYSDQVDAAMAGARATAVILAVLPVFGVLLGEAIGAAPLAFLTGGGAGGWCLVIGSALLSAGLWWVERITGRLPT